VLAGLKWAPFRASSDRQLLPIRIMELTKSMAQVEADAALAADTKKAKLDQLRAQKAKYEAELAAAG
jgi:phosphonate transport system substrate-binding protein